MQIPTLDQVRAARRRLDLLAYLQAQKPAYQAGWFHADLAEKLEQWVAGCIARTSPRLMVFAPPRHGKSEECSRALPAWFLGNFPAEELILASYGQDLANDMSRDAQAYTQTEVHKSTFPEFALSKEAVENWLTTAGGGLKAVGVGGPITGRGGHLIIDDPNKGAAEAASPLYRESQKRWYADNARTRVPPGGGILIIMTRWHLDDLAGALLAMQALDPDADQWEVAEYQAIATKDEPHRKEGEALDAGRWPLKALASLRAAMSPYSWNSLYQQRPVSDGGGRIKSDWLKATYKTLPAEAKRVVHSWDTAIKAGQLNDFSVCTVARPHDQRLYIADVQRRRMEFPELLAAVKSLAMRDNPQSVLIEDKGSGQQLIQMLRRDKDWHWSIIPITPTVDKITRMDAVTPWLESGRVWIPEAAPWLGDWLAELLGFPVAAHDDQIDSLSQMLEWLDGFTGGATWQAIADRNKAAAAQRPVAVDPRHAYALRAGLPQGTR